MSGTPLPSIRMYVYIWKFREETMLAIEPLTRRYLLGASCVLSAKQTCPLISNVVWRDCH